MAARFWRRILALGLCVAAASGATAVLLFSQSAPTGASIAAGVLALGPAAGVALSFLRARAIRPSAEPAWGLADALRALLSEIVVFPRAVLSMCGRAARRRAPPREGPPAVQSTRPVLLLHGFLCNGRVWRSVRDRLGAAGYDSIETIDVEPLFEDIDRQAVRVAPVLRDLQRRCAGERVTLVGHSMGGLLARALLRDLGEEVIRGIVSIGSPHHGTAMMREPAAANLRQMRRGSAWLALLNTAQEGRLAVPTTCIYSPQDNLVVPAQSACLRGAAVWELPGIGHLGLLQSRRAIDCIVAAVAAVDAQ